MPPHIPPHIDPNLIYYTNDLGVPLVQRMQPLAPAPPHNAQDMHADNDLRAQLAAVINNASQQGQGQGQQSQPHLQPSQSGAHHQQVAQPQHSSQQQQQHIPHLQPIQPMLSQHMPQHYDGGSGNIAGGGNIDPAISGQHAHHALDMMAGSGGQNMGGGSMGVQNMGGGNGGSGLAGSGGAGSGEEDGDGRKGAKRELSQSKRAAQNRAAQRAFRQRKEGYIKTLESKVRDLASLEESFKALQTENYTLRDYVLQLQRRLLESQGDYPQPPPMITAIMAQPAGAGGLLAAAGNGGGNGGGNGSQGLGGGGMQGLGIVGGSEQVGPDGRRRSREEILERQQAERLSLTHTPLSGLGGRAAEAALQAQQQQQQQQQMNQAMSQASMVQQMGQGQLSQAPMAQMSQAPMAGMGQNMQGQTNIGMQQMQDNPMANLQARAAEAVGTFKESVEKRRLEHEEYVNRNGGMFKNQQGQGGNQGQGQDGRPQSSGNGGQQDGEANGEERNPEEELTRQLQNAAAESGAPLGMQGLQ